MRTADVVASAVAGTANSVRVSAHRERADRSIVNAGIGSS
jgi:hypothetical protein